MPSARQRRDTGRRCRPSREGRRNAAGRARASVGRRRRPWCGPDCEMAPSGRALGRPLGGVGGASGRARPAAPVRPLPPRGRGGCRRPRQSRPGVGLARDGGGGGGRGLSGMAMPLLSGQRQAAHRRRRGSQCRGWSSLAAAAAAAAAAATAIGAIGARATLAASRPIVPCRRNRKASQCAQCSHFPTLPQRQSREQRRGRLRARIDAPPKDASAGQRGRPQRHQVAYSSAPHVSRSGTSRRCLCFAFAPGFIGRRMPGAVAAAPCPGRRMGSTLALRPMAACRMGCLGVGMVACGPRRAHARRVGRSTRRGGRACASPLPQGCGDLARHLARRHNDDRCVGTALLAQHLPAPRDAHNAARRKRRQVRRPARQNAAQRLEAFPGPAARLLALLQRHGASLPEGRGGAVAGWVARCLQPRGATAFRDPFPVPELARAVPGPASLAQQTLQVGSQVPASGRQHCGRARPLAVRRCLLPSRWTVRSPGRVEASSCRSFGPLSDRPRTPLPARSQTTGLRLPR